MPNISASYGALTLTSRRQDDWGNWSEAAADAVFTFPAIPAGAQVGTATLTLQVGQDPICGAYMTVDGQSVLTQVGARSISITVPAGTSSRTVRVSFKGTGKTYSVSQVGITGMTLSLSYVVPMSAWSLTKTQAAAGEEIGVSITPATASARHKVTYAFGSQAASYALAAGVTSHSMTIPLDWCAQIPNATYGTGTVTLETLDASGNVLGTESKPITITVPDSVVPTLSGLTVTGIDLHWGLYLQGVSSAQAAASGAAGAQGGAIRAYTVAGGGYSAAAQELVTGPLNTAGVNTFRATVTDSRGRVSEAKEAAIEVTAYSPAALTEVQVARCLESGAEDDAGTYLRCVIGYEWTAVGENACLVRISVRASGEAAWTQLYEGTPESGSALVVGGGAILEGSSWEVLVQAADAIGGDQVIRKVPTAHTFFLADPANDSFAFGCYPEGAKRLRLAEDWAFYTHGKEIAAWMAEKAGAEEIENAIQAARVWNLLDNSDFTNPVNQRGKTSWTSGNVYCIDRWIAAVYKDKTGSVVLSDGCVQFINTSADYVGLIQKIPIELVRGKEGVSFTAAYGDADGNVYSVSFPFGKNTGGKAMGGIKVYSTAPNDTYASVHYRNENAGTTTSAQWFALYEGEYTADILPPYVPKGYTAEMLACKRYCRVIDWGTTRYTGFFGAATSGTTAVYAILPIDVPMRVTPSLSSTAGTNFRLYGGDVSFNPTSVSVWFAGNNAIGLVFACTAVAGRVYVVYPATGTPIVLSADL